MTSEDYEYRLEKVEHALFGNGREGLKDRFTRAEVVLNRLDAFIHQVKFIILGQVVAFLVALGLMVLGSGLL